METEYDYLGKIAYDGYCHASGNKSLVSGDTLPEYDVLSDDIKDAWCSAALRIVTYVQQGGMTHADR